MMWLVDNLNFDYMPNMADPIFQPAQTITTQRGSLVVMCLMALEDPKDSQTGDMVPIPYFERELLHSRRRADGADTISASWRFDVEASSWDHPATRGEGSRSGLDEDRGIFEDLWQAVARLVKGSPVNEGEGDGKWTVQGNEIRSS